MKIFVAASYSSQVDYSTGHVLTGYKEWLEGNLSLLEGFGHSVFCALRADRYRINKADPAEAFTLDVRQIEAADGLVAFLSDSTSAGVQTEIGYALALQKPVVLIHAPEVELSWFNKAIVAAGKASVRVLPITSDPL